MFTLRSFAHLQKSRSRAPAVVLAGVTAAAALVGCGTGTPRQRPTGTACAADAVRSPGTVVITATASSTEPAPHLPASVLERLRTSADQGTPTCVLLVGPDEQVQALDVTARRPSGAVENGPDRGRKVDANLVALDRTVSTLARRAPGVDPLAALDAATRRHPVPGTVVLITSGVSTVDPVDLRALTWGLDPEAVARGLATRRQIPDLTGWHVVLAGIGDTQGTQPSLGPALRERLAVWWTDICRAGRAAECTVDRQLVSTDPPSSRNTVPLVPLPVVGTTPQRVVVPGVLFSVDSADIDPQADAALGDVVERARTGDRDVRVVGRTDAVTGSRGWNTALAGRRARAVADRLVALGLPPERLASVTGAVPTAQDAVDEQADPRRIDADRNVEITFVDR